MEVAKKREEENLENVTRDDDDDEVFMHLYTFSFPQNKVRITY